MARSLVPFVLVAALLSAGCIPVGEPVGDIDKAEPNKELLGEWNSLIGVWVVDRPEVKGNPKGLIRLRVVERGRKLEDVPESYTFWLFTATAGKHTCANFLRTRWGNVNVSPNFAEEGEYAEWTKSEKCGYWVVLLTLKDDTLLGDLGDREAFENLMTAEKITRAGQFHQTKPGWLTEYLEKQGPKQIFTGEEVKLTRVKKK